MSAPFESPQPKLDAAADRDALAAALDRVRAVCKKASPSGGSVHVSTIEVMRAIDGSDR